MGSLVLSVVTLSSGLALAARSIQSPAGSGWGGPPVGFFTGLAICAAGVFMLVRGLTRRSSGMTRVSVHATAGAWRRSGDASALLEAPDGSADRAWGAEYGGGGRMARRGSELRAAARALLFSCDEDSHRSARTRRAVRAACRRAHLRSVGHHHEPQRRRVRPRPRLFT